MRERALVIGDDPALVGILTRPEPSARAEGSPTVIWLNAGTLHRVGPNRLYVGLARALAEEGITSLRLDLSGLGDSEARRDETAFEEAHVEDTRAAMDFLEQREGARSFVLAGLCAGADTALRTAGRDERVTGLIPMDGYAYRTPGYYLRHYGQRILRPGHWASFLRRKLVDPLLDGGEEEDEDSGLVDPYVRDFPPREEVCRQLQELTDRGVRFLFVYTAGQEKYLNDGAQFGEMFGSVEFGDAARTEYFESSDHIFTLLRNQRRLEDTVRGWLGSVSWSVTADDAAVKDRVTAKAS